MLKQTILIENPPIYDRIAQVFDVEGKSILYAWGDRIYNPGGIIIPKELISHERIHGERQGTDEASVLAWWDRYLVDAEFRFNEELPAHREEYLSLAKRHRDKQMLYLQYVGEKLASSLYGNMVTVEQAKDAIIRLPK